MCLMVVFLDDDLEKFIEEVLKVNGHGLSPLRNASIESNWSFGHALFFASTVITTIGTLHRYKTVKKMK